MRGTKRWPIWKIAVTCLGCAGAAVGLFVAMAVAERTAPAVSTAPGERPPALTPASFLLMMGVAASALAVLSTVWLGYRLWDAHTPDWKKRRKRR